MPSLNRNLSWAEDYESRRETFTRRAQGSKGNRERMLLMAWFVGLGIVSFCLGIGIIKFVPAMGRAARKGLAYTTSLSAKEEALNMTLLRQCCKNVAPGIIMSTEFEAVRHFVFAILDGHSLAIDVMDYKQTDRSAFRKGAALCVQFVQENRACIGMMEVLATRENGKRLRVILDAPGRLVDIAMPRSFHVPVPDTSPLRAQLTLKRDGKEVRWLSRVAEIGALSLHVAVDAETPKLEPGQVLEATVRYLEQRADVRAKVTAVEDKVVALDVLPDAGMRGPPEAYKSVAKQAELAWVAA